VLLRRSRHLAVALLTALLATFGLVACTPTPPPLRVELWGDSISAQASSYFDYFIGVNGKAVGRTHALGGSALCDWFADMRAETDPTNPTAFHPQVVVIQFSGDAFTPCMKDAAGRSLTGQALINKYAHDAALVVGYFSIRQIPVYFVSTPISVYDAMAGTVGMTALGRMFSMLPARFPAGNWVRFIDAAAAVEWHGKFSVTLPCLPWETCTGRWPDGTRTVVVREADGVHFCPTKEVPIPGNPFGLTQCPVYMGGAFRFAMAIIGPILHDSGRS
jgi:hypothetical protein